MGWLVGWLTSLPGLATGLLGTNQDGKQARRDDCFEEFFQFLFSVSLFLSDPINRSRKPLTTYSSLTSTPAIIQKLLEPLPFPPLVIIPILLPMPRPHQLGFHLRAFFRLLFINKHKTPHHEQRPDPVHEALEAALDDHLADQRERDRERQPHGDDERGREHHGEGPADVARETEAAVDEQDGPDAGRRGQGEGLDGGVVQDDEEGPEE